MADGVLPEDFPLPPYTYIPGQTPHPVSDPQGHMSQGYQLPEWSFEEQLRWGKRLFEQGFYWEAHEAWEQCWHSCRDSPTGDAIKGLIKLAAAGVKHLEGNQTGVVRHLQRAAELLQSASTALPCSIPQLPAWLHHSKPDSWQPGEFDASEQS